MNLRIRRENLLRKISDDVMLEHICSHLSIRFIMTSFTLLNKEIHEFAESPVFWSQQIVQKMNAAVVLRLGHICAGIADNKKRFIRLYAFSNLENAVLRVNNLDYRKKIRDSIIGFTRLSSDDFLISKSLMKPFPIDYYRQPTNPFAFQQFLQMLKRR